jgi:hypothetical protein
MTPLAIEPQRRGVRVGVASAAPSGDVGRDWSSVIVTAQAGSLGVRSLQAMAGLFLMIEREILTQNVPAVRDVANRAITGERSMGYKRTPTLVPAFARHIGSAVDQYHRGQPCK